MIMSVLAAEESRNQETFKEFNAATNTAPTATIAAATPEHTQVRTNVSFQATSLKQSTILKKE